MIRSCIPTATYRIQLHKGFTFDDTTALVPYFARLGISHLYLSPILKARAGSQHGYDVVDQAEIDPELGGEAGLRALAIACHVAGLGIIVDIVPNHMAVGNENHYWQDVLENGATSQYAGMFDIDFSPPDTSLAGKIVVPVLGEPYGQALAEGKLKLTRDAGGKVSVSYGPHLFAVRRDDYAEILGADSATEPTGWADPRRLHAVLERQHFRLCWWRTAGDMINWRRFFDVNELAGLRVEDEAVFQHVHAVTIRLYEEGLLDGVRVDHIDGLTDPAAYARTLRHALQAGNDTRPPSAPSDGPYIVVEKILGDGESLADDWGVDGTSGYDFMNEVNALQHDPAGEEVLESLWQEVRGRTESFDDMETAARLEVLRGGFAGQLAHCARGFAGLAKASVATRDLTEEGFRRALVGLVARLRVYRSYATGRTGPALALPFTEAFQAAKASLPADDASFDFILEVLEGGTETPESERIEAVRHLNQLTAPVAAKAVEDTAFYRYGRSLSRNDVGFSAARFALAPEAFLASGSARAQAWPRAMLTTATHDHKRGEDVRARLAVLSEMAAQWGDTVRYWLGITAAGRMEIVAADDAYTLFQTLVGSWPIELKADDAEGLAAFGARVAAWRQKSLREAKMRSSWAAPDEEYERANLAWLETLLNPAESSLFLHSLVDFVGRVAPAGAVNGVVQAALRCAWPGIPDLYQGAELWDLSMVDPDNRRPVDYSQRLQLLEGGTRDWVSGSIKQAVIAELLAWRRAEPALFTEGSVETLETRGVRCNHVLAFRRRAGDRCVSVAAMLHVASASFGFGALPDAAWWDDTEIRLGDDWVLAAEIFAEAAVFYKKEGSVLF